MARLICLQLCLLLVAPWGADGAEPLQPSLTVQLKPTRPERVAPVITALAADPRGQLLAVAGDDHVIRVLSTADWSVVASLDLHRDWIRDLHFSGDGRLLASVANDGRLILWERDQRWRTVEALGEVAALRAVRFSPDGSMVATVGFAPEVYLVGVDSDRRPRLNCGCQDLRAIAYRHDGLLLGVAGRSGDLHLYDAITGSTIEDVQLHSRRINAMSFIGNTGRTLTVGDDGHVVIYDTTDRRVVHSIKIPRTKLLSACMIESSFAAVGGTDNTIHIIDLETGELVQRLVGHSGSVSSLVYREGTLYSGSFDTTMRAWSVANFSGTARVAGADAAQVPDARTSRLP
jgi:WD40 repeat protein